MLPRAPLLSASALVGGPSRRRLLQSGALAGLSLSMGLPRQARADTGAARRFLFVFASGGWDLSWGLYPFFDNSRVDSPEDGSAAASIGALRYVDGPERPAVRQWFQRWGRHTCLLHGFEVRSVAHLNCRRLAFTGSALADGDDWPTLIAAHGIGPDAPLPHLIISGPGFAASYPDLVGRVGASGQLAALLDRSMLARRDVPLEPLPDAAHQAVADWLAKRHAITAGAAATPAGAALHARLGAAHAGLPVLEDAFAQTDIGLTITFPDQLRLACDVLEAGISRCALVKHNGLSDMTWDSHGSIEGQALHYQDLFSGLEELMTELSSRTGPSGGTLLDETCVVVLSEMSRHPQRNSLQGKDHWTWTSAMLVGSGVAGGTQVGGYDSDVFGERIDPTSGEPSASGIRMEARHLGATLLALADIDPDLLFAVETPPILAALQS